MPHRCNQSHPRMGLEGPPSMVGVALVCQMMCSSDPKLHPRQLAPTGPTHMILPTHNRLNSPRPNFNSRPKAHPRASLSLPRCSLLVHPLPGPPLPGTPMPRWWELPDPQQGDLTPLDRTGGGLRQFMRPLARLHLGYLTLTLNLQIPQGPPSPS